MAINTEQLVQNCISVAEDRYDFWANFINMHGAGRVIEIGVFQGNFAAKMLRNCDCLEKYYMLDPWKNLDDWDKPANMDNETLELLMKESLYKTEFASDKRIVLRGKTTEVIDGIPDRSLDLAYIDGDHTLKGITIDLIRVYPKIKKGGFIGGDDFCPDTLQHFPEFEPTLVYPFAIYFAEAMSARIYTLPYEQFLIEKSADGRFELIDLAGCITNTGLKKQMIKTMQEMINNKP